MKIGTACEKITPTRPVWMAGFAARDHPSEGVYQDLFAKALALDDGKDRAALITTDLLFFDDLRQQQIESRLRDALGLEPHQIILTASHTHSAPAINQRERGLYPEVDEEYAADVVARICAAVERAFGSPSDGDLAFGVGRSQVGVNRRLSTPQGVVMQPNPDGPMDPEVPVLRAGSAVVMNYACHPSTYNGYLIGGDYPGFAQETVEQRLPGAQAMFVQGCGGDVKSRNIGPDGRFQAGPLENVERLGREFGEAVRAALDAPMQPVAGELTIRRADFTLPLADPPTRTEAQAALGDANRWRAQWAKSMLEIIERGGEFQRTAPAMVQVLSIGDFVLVALSGEVGVEIGLRIKRMLAGRRAMVAAYAGPSVMTDYVMPRHRFPEGGYDVDGNFFYVLWPAPLRPEAEDLIIEQVTALTGG